MDSDRAAASVAGVAGSRRAFHSALDHLFAETERQLHSDSQDNRDASSAKEQRRAARASGGSSSSRVAASAAPSAPVTGGLFLDSDALDDDDDGSIGDAEEDAARLANVAIPSPRQAFGADTQRSNSGRHTARNGGAGDLSSRRRAASSGRTASVGSSSLYPGADGGYDTFSRPVPMSFAPVAYATGPSHHEMELLQRVEHVRSSVEHYRQSSELAGRVLDTKVRSQLQSLVSKLNVQLRELEERLNSHYATSANISLNHTLEFRRKIKSDLKQFKAQMESWCAGETARLQAIEAKVNQRDAGSNESSRSSAAAPVPASPAAADSRTPAPIQALQLQQQLLADRQELLSLKLHMEQSALRDAARDKAHREEMDELRAEMRRMQQGMGAAATPSSRTLAAPPVSAAAAPPSPNNNGPASARGSEAPTRSEFQHLQSLFHRLEHSHNTQAVEFTHLQQSHERHLELVAQSQTKASQRLVEDVQQLGQHLTALQNQVDDGAATQAAAAAATSPSARQRAGPKSPPQQASEGRGAVAATGDAAADAEELRSRMAALQTEMDQHRRLFDAVGAELKDHTERLAQLDQAQSAAAAATSAAVTGHAEQHKVAELLSSTISTLDEQVVELADKVLALEEAAAAAKPAGSPAAAEDSDSASTHAAQQSQHDRLLSRVTELDAEVQSLSTRLSETESLPAAVEGLRSAQSVILGELERQSGAHLDRSAVRTATVAEIAAQVTAIEEKVGVLSATVDKISAETQPLILDELHDAMELARALDNRVVTLEANTGLLSPSGGGGSLPPALRPVLESLQHQLDNLSHRSEDSEAYFSGELEQQRMMLLRHGEILHSVDDGQITEEDEEGEDEEHGSAAPSSGRARPPSPPSRAQLQWQRKQAALAREAAANGSENLDEVSMDFPAVAPGALSVQIPQTRPGSSQSVLSTRSVHPLVDGFDSRPATAQVEQEEEEAPSAAAAATAAPAHADLFGSPRAVMPRSKAAKGKASAAEGEDASANVSSRSGSSASHSASSTPSASKPQPSATGNTTPPVAAVTSASKSKRDASPRPRSPADSEGDYEYDPDFVNASPSPSPLPQKTQPAAEAHSEKSAAAASSPAKKALDFGTAAPATAASSSSAAAPVAAVATPSAPSTFRPSNSATCRTAAEFARLREELRAYGVDRVQSDQLALGWLSRDAASGALKIATEPKPFNPFARLVSGLLPVPYGNLLESVGVSDPAASRFMVARNRPELDAAWNDGSAEMLGKASMARHHEFMLLRDLTQWDNFNAATFGIRGDAASLTESIQLIDDISRVAHAYAAQSHWSSQLGLFVHAFPFNSVHALHVHMLDLETTGPTFHHLAHKNLPLAAVRQVLIDELRAVDASAAKRLANPTEEKVAASRAEEEDEISEEYDESEEPEQQEDSDDEDASRAVPPKRSSIGAAAEASARAALRSELDGKRLELTLSCGELPINCCAILLSEKLDDAPDADWIKRGWTESQNGQTNPAFETPMFLTFHAGESPEAAGQAQQEIRLELFDTSSVSSGSRPALVASVHVLLEEIAFALGQEVSFPFSGFPQDLHVALDQTPHVNIRAALAVQPGEERVMRTPVAAGRQEQEESKDSAFDDAGSKSSSPSASKFASASSAPASSASVASPARSISTTAPVVLLNLRATNLPVSVASVALFVQDATLSPARVSRSETQPPTEFTFVAHASTAPIPADLQESEEVPFNPGLAFVYSRGHILKLNLYSVSNPSRGLVDDEARLGSVFIRQDDLYESAMESASGRAHRAEDAEDDEEEAAELTFFFNHEQPEKNDALEEIELIVESRIVPEATMQQQQQQQQAADDAQSATAAATTHASSTVTRSSGSDASTAAFTHTVSVSISCRGLPLSKPSGTCDPIAAAFIHAAEGDGFEYVSQSEWLRDTRDPNFEDWIQLEHRPFQGQLVKFSVYDVSSESVSDDERIGSVLVNADDLFQTMPESGISGAGGDASNLDATFNTTVQRSPEALARALVEGIGNEMIYELLHENPEKQARLKGATICIAYTATSLQGNQASAAAASRGFDESHSESDEHPQQSGLRTPPSARKRQAGAADDDYDSDESPLEDLDAESDHPYSSSDLGTQRDDSASSYANSAINRSSAGAAGIGGGLHRQSHNDNLETRRSSSQAATPNNLSPVAAAGSAGAKSSAASPSSGAAAPAVSVPGGAACGFGGASSIPTASRKVSAAAASMGIGALLSNIARGEFDDDDEDEEEEDEQYSEDERSQPTASPRFGEFKPAASSQMSPSGSLSARGPRSFGAPAAAAALPSSFYEGGQIDDDIEEDLDGQSEEED